MQRLVTNFIPLAGAAALALTVALALLTTAAVTPAYAQAGDAAAQPADDGAPYASPMRAQCEDELIKDATWRAELKLQLAPEIHEQDANQMLTNRRHVVLSYALLWALMLLFVVFMWRRQRGLSAEISRLEREIERAASE
ncbi:MAG: hypothetical protein Tsb0020_00240 [Haliangiales bacterium]